MCRRGDTEPHPRPLPVYREGSRRCDSLACVHAPTQIQELGKIPGKRLSSPPVPLSQKTGEGEVVAVHTLSPRLADPTRSKLSVREPCTGRGVGVVPP